MYFWGQTLNYFFYVYCNFYYVECCHEFNYACQLLLVCYSVLPDVAVACHGKGKLDAQCTRKSVSVYGDNVVHAVHSSCSAVRDVRDDFVRDSEVA